MLVENSPHSIELQRRLGNIVIESSFTHIIIKPSLAAEKYPRIAIKVIYNMDYLI